MKKTVLKLVIGLSVLIAPTVNAQTIGTIAVGDITYSVKGADSLRPKANVISAIDRGLNQALLKTRKFNVLNREQLSQRINKQGLNLNDYYGGNHSGTQYTQAGLDYILRANVSELGVFDQKRGQSQSAVGVVVIDYKLIGVADKTSDMVSSVSAQSSKGINTGGVAARGLVLDQAIQQAVDQLVDQIITDLFPIRIVQIAQEGEIKLNFGVGLLSPGDTVLVYPLGEEIVVDDNGEVASDAIATLQIITTEKKFARAQALNGLGEIKKGQQGHLLLSGG